MMAHWVRVCALQLLAQNGAPVRFSTSAPSLYVQACLSI